MMVARDGVGERLAGTLLERSCERMPEMRGVDFGYLTKTF